MPGAQGFRRAVSYRRAGAADLGAIIDLRIEFERITRDSGSLDEPWRRDELEAILTPDLARGILVCWVADVEGRAVAQAALRLSGRPSTGGRLVAAGALAEGEILNVYTVAAYRGRGIASALLDLAIAEAVALRLLRLRLQPTPDSRRIYERAGFEAAGRTMVLNFPAVK